MNTLLNKSYRLKRYHMVIVIILVFFLVSIMLRYIAMLRASIEKMAFHNNLGLIERMILIHQAFAQNTSTHCQEFKDFNYIQQIAGGGLRLQKIDINTQSLAPFWTYDPERHVLTYHILSQQYFQSSIGNKITIKFNCASAKTTLDVSPHRWCKDMGLWKCNAWE